MGTRTTTDQIVASLGFTYNRLITQENFPLRARQQETDVLELVRPSRGIAHDEALRMLQERSLLRPTHEHAIRFAEQYGRANTISGVVVFLHNHWFDPKRKPRLLALSYRYHPWRRNLCLRYANDQLADYCLLAGVRPQMA